MPNCFPGMCHCRKCCCHGHLLLVPAQWLTSLSLGHSIQLFFCRISPPVFLVHVVSWSWPTCWRQRCAHAPGLDRVSHPFHHSRVSVVKNLPATAGDLRDLGSIPGSGRFPWSGAWQPIPMFLPGESHGQRSLAGYSPQGCKELDTTEGT